MSKKKSRAKEHLRDAAKALLDEINSGTWNHISELKTRPIGEQIELAKELEKRSPGHSKEVYLETIGRALWNNR